MERSPSQEQPQPGVGGPSPESVLPLALWLCRRASKKNGEWGLYRGEVGSTTGQLGLGEKMEPAECLRLGDGRAV